MRREDHGAREANRGGRLHQVSELREATAALARVLADEGRLYEWLLAIAARERRSITTGDVESLTRLLEEKESVVERHHALETERMTALVAVAAATGGAPQTLSLTEVVAALPADERGAIIEAGVWLHAQAVALREATKRNATLLHHSRELVDCWLQHLRLLVGSRLADTAEWTPGEASGPRALDPTA